MQGIHNPEDFQQFNLSRRHLTRLQALLAEGIQCTPILLEMVAENGNHSKLLLDMSLLKNAAALNAANLAELQKIHLTADDPPLQLIDQNGVRVIGLEEEALSEQILQANGGSALPGTGSQRLPPQAPAQTSGPSNRLPASGDGSQSGRSLATFGGPGQGSGSYQDEGGLFGGPMLQQLKLKLMTAADPGQRAEALRILGLSPLDNAEKTELYLKALADASQDVRAEAARLLRDQGFKTDLANALAGISSGETEQRTYHLTRLSRMLDGASEMELTGAMICLLRRVDEEPLPELLKEVLNCVAQALRGQSVGRSTVAEVLRATLAVFSRHSNQIIGGVRQVFAVLRGSVAGELEERLWVELERNPSDVVRAECLSQIELLLRKKRESGLAAEQCDALARRLAAAGVQFLAQDESAGYAARNVGSVLMELSNEAVIELVAAIKVAKSAQIVYMMRLLDYIVRFRPLQPENKQLAGRTLLHVLTRGDQQVRTAAMETTLATDPQLDPALRVELAEAFFEHLKDLMFQADMDSAEATIARMGTPAIEVLMKHLAPLAPQKQRVTAVRILGETVRLMAAPKDSKARTAYREIVEGVLRQLKLLSMDEQFPDPGEVDLCLGKVASSPGLARESIMVCARHLLNRADQTVALLDRARNGEFGTDPLVWRSAALSLEGLSWLCTSRNITQQVINDSFKRFQKILEAPMPDSGHADKQSRDSEGETVFEVGPSVEILVEIVPATVTGTTRLALAPVGHSKIAKDTAGMLQTVWRQSIRGEILLSPGNSISLVESLRSLGVSTRIPAAMAIDILKSLAQRKDDPVILMHMAILAAESPYRELLPYAVKVGMEICKHRDKNGNFDPELREYYLAGLAAAVGRKDLPGDAPPVRALRREALQCLVDGMSDGVPHCAANLAKLRDKKVLAPAEQAELENRLKNMPVLFVREESYRW